MISDMKEILEKIEFLFEKYSLERRGMTQPYLLTVVREKFKEYSYNPEDALVRETLMEHIGSTPVVATALFPYINDVEVNLGDALVMLSIHDIGELITGDKITFLKVPDPENQERKAALKLLDPYYHKLYGEIEDKSTPTGKFAKSIDKITPDIYDYLTPADVTKKRFNHFMGFDDPDQIIEMIVKHKRPHMLWSPFMAEFHIYLMERLTEKLKE